MKIGILQTGRAPDDLIDEYGDYPAMFARLLNAADQSLDFRTYAVLDDHFPAGVRDCDGWLITGSRHGVYENLPWMRRLQDFLRVAHAEQVPIVGICFGHQILAEALGGKVVRSDKGWSVGVQTYAVLRRPEWMDGDVAQISIQALHQDQVVELPPGAEVLASSEFCAYAALAIGPNAITFQAHPEFGPDFTRALLEARRGVLIPETIADAAIPGVDAPIGSSRIAHWISRFLHMARESAPGAGRARAAR